MENTGARREEASNIERSRRMAKMVARAAAASPPQAAIWLAASGSANPSEKTITSFGASTAVRLWSRPLMLPTNWPVRLRSSMTRLWPAMATSCAHIIRALPDVPSHSRVTTASRTTGSPLSRANASPALTATLASMARPHAPAGMRLTASTMSLCSRVNPTSSLGPGSEMSPILSVGPNPASRRSTDSAAARSPPNAMLASSTTTRTRRPVVSDAFEEILPAPPGPPAAGGATD